MNGPLKYVLLTGSDLGNKVGNLKRATDLVTEHIGELLDKSQIYESEPWGFSSTTVFMNQALLVASELEPEKVLERIHFIEKLIGRFRNDSTGYESRIIDIDILCCETVIHKSESLTIPHSLLHQRLFALKPLCELKPDWKHPLLELTYSELLTELDSQKPAQSSS